MAGSEFPLGVAAAAVASASGVSLSRDAARGDSPCSPGIWQNSPQIFCLTQDVGAGAMQAAQWIAAR
jgi:hypothetical protein